MHPHFRSVYPVNSSSVAHFGLIPTPGPSASRCAVHAESFAFGGFPSAFFPARHCRVSAPAEGTRVCSFPPVLTYWPTSALLFRFDFLSSNNSPFVHTAAGFNFRSISPLQKKKKKKKN
jgi:hypothetical protein